MYKQYVLLFLVTSLLLSSCDQAEVANESKEEKIIYSFKHPETDQEYQIIHVYKLYKNFEKEIAEKSNISKSTAFEEQVIQPIYDACYKDAEYFERVGNTLSVQVPENEEQINELNDLIKTMDEDVLNSSIKEALIKSSNYIGSNIKTNICIYPTIANLNTAFMVTEGSGKISVLYNKYYNENILKSSIAHEYHHSVWTEKYFNKDYSDNVLDTLIFEGKAVMFEKIVYPEITATRVNYSYNKDQWRNIEPDLYKYDLYRASEIINGGGDLPKSYGYSEGYKMVKSYLEKYPDLKPEEWTAISSQEIYEKGKYLDNYK